MISSPEPDTYGQYARVSLLADYVELLALKGRPVQRASVADFLADNDWDFGLIVPADGHPHLAARPGVLAERLDEADETASIVYRQLDERSDVLGDRYPFTIDNERISLGPGVDPKASAYIAILALTVAHAFKVPSSCRPEVQFEQTVTDVLCKRGLAAVGFAAVRRESGSFENALAIACDRLGLVDAIGAAARLKRAHDEKVDVLGHIGWEDDLRLGTWGFIGQVTVGRSDSWERKIAEPSRDRWKQFTSMGVSPSRFLAVPHHVERSMLEILTGDDKGIVLDRLRLVKFKTCIFDSEREIIEAVLGEDVEPLTG